jgi:SpoVK/Ycf46/Vps4 family AAA+-type ATPase
MKALRVPAWLRSGLLARYHSGASHLFLLHGNIRDVHPFGREYLPLAEGLRRLAARRPFLVGYDVSRGLLFPDREREQEARRVLGLRRGALPSDPARALVVLDALVATDRCPSGSVAVVIEFAHALAPASPASPAERQAVATLARWATDPAVAARRPLVVLIAPGATDVSEEVYAGASGAEVVEVPRPDEPARAEFARHLADSGRDDWQMTPEELARETGGLSLVQMEDIHQRARASREPLGRDAVVARKVDLLRQEYADVLDILEPRFDLGAVGGLDYAVRELREVADIMRRGLVSAAPMGIMLMGPPGTGKSYLAECFARECGMLCVRFRPLRQMYVGQSERNQVRAFAAIRSLAPVVVLVDESDQAEGGRRGEAGGDSGVSERMRAGAFAFWGDSSLRGRVLRIDITNRVDLIDSAMRRSGRTDVKIPILMPDEEARREIFQVTLRKHRLPAAITDFRPFARRSHGYAGSDIELAVTTAWRFTLSQGKPALEEAALGAALDDLLPTARDQQTIDRMTLLALDECRNRRLLPPNHEAIRREIAARLKASG